MRLVVVGKRPGAPVAADARGNDPAGLHAAAADLNRQGPLGALVAEHLDRVAALPPGEASRRFSAAFAEDAPRAIFFLVPVLALLLKALHRRRTLGEHLVLALHAQTVGCLALLPGAIVGADWVSLLGMVAAVAWLVLALRRVHRRGWLATALGAAAIVAGYLVALALVLSATGVLALLAV
jgi:hypothetical protein